MWRPVGRGTASLDFQCSRLGSNAIHYHSSQSGVALRLPPHSKKAAATSRSRLRETIAKLGLGVNLGGVGYSGLNTLSNT
jgi:hypothetical protein